MQSANLLRANPRLSTLCAAFLYFDLSFAVWILFGALGTFIVAEFSLPPWRKGLLVALPIVAGSGFRILLGWAETRFGGKRTALAGMGATFVPLLWGWVAAKQAWELTAIGLLLGIAGASFAVALPMASRWFPPAKQGLVLGLAGAGNSGTLLATLLAPPLASRFGWRAVFGLALLPMLLAFLAVLFLAQDAPQPGAAVERSGRLRDVLRRSDSWTFCILYSVTFGGFVGLTSFLGILFADQYGVSKVTAGLLQTLAVAAGSALRPVGGWLADRIGGRPVLTVLFASIVVSGLAASSFPSLPAEASLFFALLGALGMGNGAVFQLVGVQARQDIGLVTGMVGAAGGLGGFLLPLLLGILKSATGSYAPGLLLYVCVVLLVASGALGSSLFRHWLPRLLRPLRRLTFPG